MNRCIALTVAVYVALFVFGHAGAAEIASASATNTSTADGGGFSSVSTLSPITTGPTSSSFSHRIAYLNEYTGNGGVAQTHRKNVNFRIDFTVSDPGNLGFDLSASSLLRGISTISQTTDTPNAAVATGTSFGVDYDDSTDPGESFNALVPLFIGTPGVSVVGIDTLAELQEETANHDFGHFVGTTSFILAYSTFGTPTTNIFFQNNEMGSGSINYGLGDIDPAFDVTAEELGHFLTITVTFRPVPEPSSLALFATGMIALLGLRRRRRS